MKKQLTLKNPPYWSKFTILDKIFFWVSVILNLIVFLLGISIGGFWYAIFSILFFIAPIIFIWGMFKVRDNKKLTIKMVFAAIIMLNVGFFGGLSALPESAKVAVKSDTIKPDLGDSNNSVKSNPPTQITPKHSFNEFAKWLHAPVQYKYNEYVPAVEVERFRLIRDKCSGTKNNFDSRWSACMQEAYKDYIKPEAFVGDEKNTLVMLDFLGMVDGYNDFGTDSSSTNLTKADVDGLRNQYNSFAVTK